MLSSLIQTNRGEMTEEEIPDEPDQPKQVGKQKQLKLDSAFRPVLKQRQSRRRSKATLIIAPASLLDQWANELRRSCQKGTANVFVWHGQGREDLETMIDVDIDAIDVVITSYGTLVSEHGRLEKSQTKAVPIYDSKRHSQLIRTRAYVVQSNGFVWFSMRHTTSNLGQVGVRGLSST